MPRKRSQEAFSHGKTVVVTTPSHPMGGRVGVVTRVARAPLFAITVAFARANETTNVDKPHLVDCNRDSLLADPTDEQLAVIRHARAQYLAEEAEAEAQRAFEANSRATVAMQKLVRESASWPVDIGAARDGEGDYRRFRFPNWRPSGAVGDETRWTTVEAHLVVPDEFPGATVKVRALTVHARALVAPSDMRLLATELLRYADLIEQEPFVN